MKKSKITIEISFFRTIFVRLATATSIFLLIISIAVNFSPLKSLAQGLQDNSGSGTQLFCKRDFRNFIVNGIDFDGEGFLDYWRDILSIYWTNYCHYMDIVSLQDRIDKARKQLRRAFYVCDNATVARVSSQYYQLSMELYYLRHFVSTAVTNPNMTEAEKVQKTSATQNIKEKFCKKFVEDKHYIVETSCDSIFLQISEKYANKIETYRNCKDPNLEQLLERINNLSGTLKKLENLGKKFTNRSKKRFSSMEKRIEENPGMITVFSAEGLKDFGNRIVDVRINNEPLNRQDIFVKDISETAKENSPFTNTIGKSAYSSIDFSNISANLNKVTRQVNDDNLDLVYMTEYELKYRQIGGLGFDKLQNNLINLEKTLSETFKEIDKITVCTANIVGKQCGNK